MHRLISVALAIPLCAACASSPPRVHADPVDTDPDQSEHFIPDMEDRCPILRDCAAEFEDDGCPDVPLVFEPGSSQLTEKNIEFVDEVAKELAQRKVILLLRIDGHAADGEPASLAAQRSAAVRDRLIVKGTPPAMLMARGDSTPSGSEGFVSFFAEKCTD